MSVEAMAWAWAQPVRGTQKLVLLAIADHANAEHQSWPSVNKVAARCGVGRRAVQNAMQSLEQEGLLRRKRRTRNDGSQSANLYVLSVNDASPPRGERADTPEDERAGDPGAHDGSSLPRMSVHPNEPPVEPSVEPSVEDNTVDEVELLWAEVLQLCPPPHRDLTPSRRRTLRQALNEAPMELCVQSLAGVVELHRQDKGAADWQRPLGWRPNRPLADQIAYFASQAPSSSSMPGTHNHVLRTAPPWVRDNLIREHHYPDNPVNVERADESRAWLAKRGYVARYEGPQLVIEKVES